MGGLGLAGALWLFATPPRLQLKYEAAPACPSAAEVSAQVRAEVGREVFDASASRAARLTIRQAAAPAHATTLVAEIEFRDEGGERDGFRQLESTDARCEDLVRGFALLTALHLQRLDQTRAHDLPQARLPERARPAPIRPRQDRPPAPVVTKAPVPPAPAPTSHNPVDLASKPAPLERPTWSWLPGAGLLMHAGLAPHLVPGIRTEMLARRGRWSYLAGVDLLGRADPADVRLGFDLFAALGSVSPCVAPVAGSWLRVDLCPFLAAGLVSVRGSGVDRPRVDHGALLHLGTEARLALRPLGGWCVTLAMGVVHDVAPWSVATDGIDRWTSPRWSSRAALLVHRDPRRQNQ